MTRRLAAIAAALTMLVLAPSAQAIAAPVRGPDYSNNNGCGINLRAVHAAGASFAAFKATEGTYFQDRCFPGYWGAALHEGFVRIAYDFARPAPGRSGAAEARYFVHYVNQHGGFTNHDFAVLDLEAESGMTQAGLRQWVLDWLQEVEHTAHPGRVGIYSGNWFWQPHLGYWFPVGPFKWVANYSPAPIVFGPGGWDLWQYTDGRYGPTPRGFAGINSDVSIFSGNHQRLLQLSEIAEQHAYASRRLHRGSQGTDVRGLQHALNSRLVARHRKPISADGHYGPATEAAKHFATYRLGFPLGAVRRRGCTGRCQQFIAHPDKRPASYLPRSAYRRR